jgi:hypothetical protein
VDGAGTRYGEPGEGRRTVPDDRIGEICSELGALIERLDDLALEALREAVAGGATARPEIERRIVRARNSLERARHLLNAD